MSITNSANYNVFLNLIVLYMSVHLLFTSYDITIAALGCSLQRMIVGFAEDFFLEVYITEVSFTLLKFGIFFPNFFFHV